ncbi:hypothetical protein P691DRAFT_810665 [Macrolepiota fuliginosa MF-IS2]|uniref:Uncharacterized protein n=1 Tax=Macrolepiota fuliginosa MF-IS2 TaxID=1400762 RepID=A0A9P5X401_9AGAR|nr:hypothetical protein P691DRAFT_810665 [Macrolepiota fuliginosa MF-IS2]
MMTIQESSAAGKATTIERTLTRIRWYALRLYLRNLSLTRASLVRATPTTNQFNYHHHPTVSSGSEDIDSDIAAAAASTNPHLPSITVSNPTSTVAAMQWGSPGAGSSASARGDSPIPLNLGVPGQVAVGVGGAGGDDAELGLVVDAGIVGMDGDTVSGKRKR